MIGRRAQDVAPIGEGEIARRRAIELELWRSSPSERPESNSLHNIVNKAQDAAILLDLIERFRGRFERAERILELGGGQGWASCVVKGLFPDAHVTTTDLSTDAVASVGKWERIFEVELDGAEACTSDYLPLGDESQDLVFCFSAAHHFVKHGRTLREMHRVLAPSGSGVYLHEPACSEYLYGAAVRRVNRKRPEVPEDVLRFKELARLAEAVGLHCEVDFYPTTARRGPAETAYYTLLGASGTLQRLLPCTANFVFTKGLPER
ncbi:MAG: class I SAM-dependent methyltransferase [Actinomycetota bacterium]|nr:class I SAM-dependent methyltransferase [Actinomycetota bacterium]